MGVDLVESEPVMMERVTLSLDVVAFALTHNGLVMLLIQRRDEPFAGQWALPGAVVRPEEGLDAAAARVLQERTRLRPDGYLEQLYTFGDPGRDPRSRTVSVAYYVLLPQGDHPVAAGRGVADVRWFPTTDLPLPLAFDHQRIAEYALTRLRQKVEYAPLAFAMLPETFTMADLRAVHEAILGEPLHPSNFVRTMLARWDLAPVPGARDRRTRRPARLYRRLQPPTTPSAPQDPPNTAG